MSEQALRCGWCDTLLRPGTQPETTGVCKPCAGEVEERTWQPRWQRDISEAVGRAELAASEEIAICATCGHARRWHRVGAVGDCLRVEHLSIGRWRCNCRQYRAELVGKPDEQRQAWASAQNLSRSRASAQKEGDFDETSNESARSMFLGFVPAPPAPVKYVDPDVWYRRVGVAMCVVSATFVAFLGWQIVRWAL